MQDAKYKTGIACLADLTLKSAPGHVSTEQTTSVVRSSGWDHHFAGPWQKTSWSDDIEVSAILQKQFSCRDGNSGKKYYIYRTYVRFLVRARTVQVNNYLPS